MSKTKTVLRKEYQEKFGLLQKLQEVAKGDIEEILKQGDITTNVVTGRVKVFDSFYKKANDGIVKGKFVDPINEIQDMVGVRAILVFVDDLEKISKLLEPTFKVLKIERKGSVNSESTFGYESDHYVLQYNQVEGPRYTHLMNHCFELQVRTILMDAWASLSHEIEYKTGGAIPSDLKRIFFGLSGMFVVADKIFQDLRKASKTNQEKLLKNSTTIEKILDQEINFDTFKTYLSLKFPDRAKLEFSRSASDGEYSEFLEEIKAIGGYELIKDIEDAVVSVGGIEKTMEDGLLKDSGATEEELVGGMHIVGTLRAIFDLYDDEYFKRTKDWPELSWVKKITENKKFVLKKKLRL